MRFLRTTTVVSLVALSAASAWAQFGLYGSPEMLRLPPPDPAVVPYRGQASPWAYPAGAAAGGARAFPQAAAHAPPAVERPTPLIQAAATERYGRIPADPAPPQAPPQTVAPPIRDIPAPGPSLVNQMLDESLGQESGYYEQPSGAGCDACDVPCGQPGCLAQAAYRFEQEVFGSCGGVHGGAWYASVYALVMSRNKANNLWLSYEDGNQPNNRHPPYDWDWRCGGEIRFGRRFCSPCGSCGDGCGDPGGAGGAGGAGGWALEATYWTLDAFSELGIVNQFGAVSTTLNFAEGNVSFGGSSAQIWFDGAEEHRVQRRNEFQDIEMTMVRYGLADYGSAWDLDWSLGVRYFRFDERLVFSSLRDTGSWSNPGDVAYLDEQITNSLVGLQFGLDAAYYIRPNWRIFLTPEFGIYNNHIVNDFRLYLGNGTVATQTAYPGLTYPVHSTDDVLSFLTQVDLGLDWQFAENWSARVGYRVIVATGIGLADNQIPFYVTDIPEIADIDHNAELILHGAFAGVAYNF